METQGNKWKHKETNGNTRKHKETNGNTRKHKETNGKADHVSPGLREPQMGQGGGHRWGWSGARLLKNLI